MLKNIKYAALTSIFLFQMSSGYAADSTITVSGNVQDNTCVLSTASANQTVNLLNYSTKQFSEKGTTTTLVPFSLIFSACGSSATAVRIGFTGVADSTDSTLLKIDSGDSTDASGIAVKLYDSNKNQIPLNQTQSSLAWNSITGGQQNTLNFYASMISTASSVTAGTVTASATITLEFQ